VELHPPASAPPPLAATIIVHVSRVGTIPVKDCAEVVDAKPPEAGVERECRGNELTTRRSEESLPLLITPLSPAGESRETSEHTVHVAPGRYEIAVNRYEGKQVTVNEGQTVEVSLVILDEG
jgi:hypothetical protein